VRLEPVTYDPEADAVYVTLNHQPVDSTVSVGDGRAGGSRIIDYASDGGVVGIEFLFVSDGIDVRDLPFADRVEALLRESGHEFVVLT
jgi:uncharacterized protein YuzE